MLTHIDHVIIAVPDLEEAATLYSTHLGFHISGGGQHPGRGTANKIIVLDPEYLELISVVDAESLHWRQLLAVNERGGGLFNIAFSSDDINADIENLRERGLDVDDALGGSLVSPNGKKRAWQAATVAGNMGGNPPMPQPFIIQHDSSGAEKRKRLAGDNSLEDHPLGVTRLAWVGYAAPSLEDGLTLFRDGYGLTEGGECSVDARLEAQCSFLRLPGGGGIRILAATDNAGPVADAAKTGIVPFELALEVSDLKQAMAFLTAQGVSSGLLHDRQAYLDPSAAQGLRLLLVEAS